MTKETITVTPDTDITEAAKLLLENRINGLPVVDKTGKLLGIICQSDLITAQKRIPLPSLFTILDSVVSFSSHQYEREMEKLSAVKVSQSMTTDVVSVGPDESLENIASMMVDRKFHTLPVVKKGMLVGVIGKEDVLRTLIESKKSE